MIDGRPVFCYAQDSSFAGGSLGEQHANTIVRVLELADKARAPVVGFVSSGGARMQEGVAALGGYGRIFHRIVKLSGRVPAGLDHHRPVRRRRRVLAGADRLGRDDRAVEHVPDRAGRRPRGARRGRHRRSARRHPRPRAQRRLPLRRADRRRTPRTWRASCSATCPRHRGARPPVPPARPPLGHDPADLVSRRPAQRLRRARRGPRARRRRRAARGVRRLGAQPGHRVRAARRPHGRRGREPAALPRRDHRRRRRAEGRALRHQVQRVRHPAGRARRHPRATCRAPSRSRRRDPVRRRVRARVRRGRGAAGDADPAQGVRRRVHHDELQGPRRRLRVRVAERPDRRDGRQVRGRDHQPPRARGGRRSRRRARRPRRALRRDEPVPAGRGRPAVTSTS